MSSADSHHNQGLQLHQNNQGQTRQGLPVDQLTSQNADRYERAGTQWRIDPSHQAFDQEPTGLPEEHTESELRDFIFDYGRYFDSYLASEPDRDQFWSQGKRGLISFKRWYRHAIIGGGLIAPEPHKPQLVREFLEYARQNRLSVAFHNIGEADLPLFQELQFQVTKWGEDPMIDLDNCTWQGKDYEWVRRQTNYCLRQGMTACEVRPDQLHPVHWSDIISEVIEVADESLTRKPQKKAMRFFEGRIDNHALGRRRLFVARYQGRIEGFVICNPILNGTGWATELYRHRQDSVRGTMAFLIHFVLQQLKQEGVERAGLCLDLGRDCHRLPGDSAMVRHGLRFAENYLTSIFDFTGLRHFKSRFRPRYEKRFACVYPKVTIGSILAFVSTTGVLDLHYGRYARILYNQHCKRKLRRNLATGKSAQADGPASPKTNSRPSPLRKSA